MSMPRWVLVGALTLPLACSAAAPPPEAAVAEPRVEPDAPVKKTAPPSAPSPEAVAIGDDPEEQNELVGEIERACWLPHHDFSQSSDEYASRCRAGDNACIDFQPTLQKLAADGEPKPRLRALRVAADAVSSAQCGSAFSRDRCSFMVPRGTVPVDTSLCDNLSWVAIALADAARSGDTELEDAAAYGFMRDTTRPDLAIPAMQAMLRRALSRRGHDALMVAYSVVSGAMAYRADAAPLLPQLREIVESRVMLDGDPGTPTLIVLAVSAIGQIGGIEALDVLTVALDDVLGEVRAAAAGALAVLVSGGNDIGPAIPTLRRRAQDRDERVRQMAKTAVTFYEQTRQTSR